MAKKTPLEQLEISQSKTFELNEIIFNAIEYQIKAIAYKGAYNMLAHSSQRKFTIMGIFSVVFSTIVGTAIFISLSKIAKNEENYEVWRIITGLISVTAAILSALQTFLGFGEKAAKYKKAAYDYEIVNNRLNSFLLKYQPFASQSNQTLWSEAITSLNIIVELFEKAYNTAPTVRPFLYNLQMRRARSYRESESWRRSETSRV